MARVKEFKIQTFGGNTVLIDDGKTVAFCHDTDEKIFAKLYDNTKTLIDRSGRPIATHKSTKRATKPVEKVAKQKPDEDDIFGDLDI